MDTSTLGKHQMYTRNEFTDNPYYTKMLNVLKDAKITSMLDVGGCTGEVTKVLQENIPTLKRCVIVEPITENVSFIKENVAADVVHGALYYGKDEITLAKLPNVGGATVHAMDFPYGSETVKTVTLEELGHFDFIKIDIEGAERNAIENSRILTAIPFIEIEFHHYDAELQHTDRRPAFVAKWLPNHRIVCGGEGSGKESSLFLSL
jgi:FkbM family methyltransferase